MKSKFSKILGVVIGISILALLIFSVPAQALVLNLDLKDAKVVKGTKAVFDASVDVKSSDPVTRLTLELDGKSKIFCEFSPEGIILSGCKGITIKDTSNYSDSDGSYGYGYGYGYGTETKKLSYQIVIDTTTYETGDYAPKLTAYTADNIYVESASTLTIKGSSGITEGEYITQSASRVCISGWKCSEWGECLDGKQTRTCQVMPNCYLENMPSQERLCINEPTTLKLSESFETLRLGTFSSEEAYVKVNSEFLSLKEMVNNQSNLMAIMFIMIVLIIITLILIIFALLLRRLNARKRRMRRIRHLNKIRYRPGK